MLDVITEVIKEQRGGAEHTPTPTEYYAALLAMLRTHAEQHAAEVRMRVAPLVGLLPRPSDVPRIDASCCTC